MQCLILYPHLPIEFYNKIIVFEKLNHDDLNQFYLRR